MMTDQPEAKPRGILQRLSVVEPAPPWGLLDVSNSLFILFLLMVLAGQVVSSAVMSVVTGGVYLEDAPVTLILGWILGALATVAYVYAVRLRPPAQRDAMRIEGSGLPLPFVLLLGLGVAVLLDVIGILIVGGIPLAAELVYTPKIPSASTLAWWILAVIFMVVVQPLAEELIFRGVMLAWLRSKLGPWVGLVAVAILYAGFHFLVYTPQIQLDNSVTLWKSLAQPLLAGLFLGGVRAYAGSTRAAIVAHVGMGIFAVLGAMLLASG